MAFVRMSGDRLCARIAECICEKVRAHESRTLTVVIDGKAAAGKTYLADYLAERLAKQGVNVCRIEADWFLESRTVREKKEQEGRREVSGHNYFPANLHFSYWKWEALREAIRKAREVAAPPGGGTFVLTGLYDRSTGECTREATIEVTPPRVLIVEGCYLLAQDLAPDVSILLYVNREIGRARKIQREEKKKEGEFPNVERVGVVITSWEQLEEPTFFWYLMEHGCKADVVVDTSDTESMSVVKFALCGQQEDELQRALRWDQRVKAAEERRNVEELLALAREAPAGGDYIRVMLLAGRLARGRLQFDVALNAFSEVLAKASGSWEAMTQKALMLERLNRIDEAQRVLETASSMLKAYVAPDSTSQAEVEGIRCRVLKQLWKARWMSPDSSDSTRRQKALMQRDLLRESLRTYQDMFREDPTSYYNGDNAAALAALDAHLSGGDLPPDRSRDEFERDRQDIPAATRVAAGAALLKNPQDYWARTTLGNLAVIAGWAKEATDHYQRALTECPHDAFAVDSVAQQLEMFQALGYRTAICEAALTILNEHRSPAAA